MCAQALVENVIRHTMVTIINDGSLSSPLPSTFCINTNKCCICRKRVFFCKQRKCRCSRYFKVKISWISNQNGKTLPCYVYYSGFHFIQRHRGYHLNVDRHVSVDFLWSLRRLKRFSMIVNFADRLSYCKVHNHW